MLYIIPTPIGNLKDITIRAIETLSSCDYILCEDTRHSAILLHHYEIKKPLKSYHQFNESSKLNEVINDLKSGKNIGLISDCGTPGICDPGSILIKACREFDLPVTALPGPCALITAFSLSGSQEGQFQFLGFFPRKNKEIYEYLLRITNFQGISIFYESPLRILETLKIFQEVMPDVKIQVTRELTKNFEEKIKGIAEEIIEHLNTHTIKGEFVVLVEKQEHNPFKDLSLEMLLNILQEDYHLSTSEAIKAAAHIRGEPKQAIYKWFHEQEGK